MFLRSFPSPAYIYDVQYLLHPSQCAGTDESNSPVRSSPATLVRLSLQRSNKIEAGFTWSSSTTNLQWIVTPRRSNKVEVGSFPCKFPEQIGGKHEHDFLELRLKLEDHQAREDRLKETEAELSALKKSERIVNWLASNFKKDDGIDLLKDKQALQSLIRVLKAKIDVIQGTRIMLTRIDDPHVDLIASVAGRLDYKLEVHHSIVRNAQFRWRSSIDNPPTFVDLYVSNSKPILLMKSCAYCTQFGIDAFGIFPVMLCFFNAIKRLEACWGTRSYISSLAVVEKAIFSICRTARDKLFH
nr:Phosphoglucosamine mutase [Ipomoea batatas]